MASGDEQAQRPLEEQVPESSVATPSEVRAAAEEITWWRPTWEDAARHVGWRWVFLTPGLLLIAMAAAAIFFQRWRLLLVALGIKLLGLLGAVSIALAAWVFRVTARARKEPFCIHCGYNLTGLPDNYRCPECGRPYTWRVIDEYRRDPQWFIERWKLNRKLPEADAPFEAGAIQRKRRDGT